jgi:hypothetical protein
MIAYACWLGMMVVHESGHVLHACLSGGRVQRVILPLLGFSRTDVFPDPDPVFVTWGGPLWGCIWPLVICGSLIVAKRRPPLTLQFFTGFCLIANGAYLGLGWCLHAGDARDLIMLGTSKYALIAFGIVTVPIGLFIWHRLGSPRAMWR